MHSAPLPKWAGAVEQARQIVRASVAGQNLPGLSVAVGIDGDIVWAEGFGFADLKTSVPVTPNHRFRIGTASTVLTSAAAGLLLENGRLKLDDEIQTYVPAFPRKQWPVTLRELMGHTAGVIPDGGDGAAFYQALRAAGGSAAILRGGLAAVQAWDPVPLFELRLDSGEHSRRSRREPAVPHVHAGADLRSTGDARHHPRPRALSKPARTSRWSI